MPAVILATILTFILNLVHLSTFVFMVGRLLIPVAGCVTEVETGGMVAPAGSPHSSRQFRISLLSTSTDDTERQSLPSPPGDHVRERLPSSSSSSSESLLSDRSPVSLAHQSGKRHTARRPRGRPPSPPQRQTEVCKEPKVDFTACINVVNDNASVLECLVPEQIAGLEEHRDKSHIEHNNLSYKKHSPTIEFPPPPLPSAETTYEEHDLVKTSPSQESIPSGTSPPRCSPPERLSPPQESPRDRRSTSSEQSDSGPSRQHTVSSEDFLRSSFKQRKDTDDFRPLRPSELKQKMQKSAGASSMENINQKEGQERLPPSPKHRSKSVEEKTTLTPVQEVDRQDLDLHVTHTRPPLKPFPCDPKQDLMTDTTGRPIMPVKPRAQAKPTTSAMLRPAPPPGSKPVLPRAQGKPPVLPKTSISQKLSNDDSGLESSSENITKESIVDLSRALNTSINALKGVHTSHGSYLQLSDKVHLFHQSCTSYLDNMPLHARFHFRELLGKLDEKREGLKICATSNSRDIDRLMQELQNIVQDMVNVVQRYVNMCG